MASKRDMEAWAIEKFGLTPIDYMMKVMVNPGNSQAERVDAAKAAAPYIHHKLKQHEIVEPEKTRSPAEIEREMLAFLQKFIPDLGVKGAQQLIVAGAADEGAAEAQPRAVRDLIGTGD